ncbi:MAG TPA: PadR family transcriptional regulator [Nocardioidaceae bacterium]|nr:PadR family transcriptional regulator [Nocardioidaceae bacterium]
MSRPRLTTTSYAILSLLAVRSWSTYELAQQMSRSLGRIWPRAESKLYEEPKKLVEHGYARARKDKVGDRPRTVYSITAAGRRALASWMAEPAAGPVLEWEQLVKIVFAENGTRADTLARLAEARAWAVERNEESLATARAYAAGEAEFQERVAVNLLGGGFLTEYYRLVAEWADWATGIVETWPDDPGQAEPDPEALRRIVSRGAWSERA